MAAYIVFIRESTRNASELEAYSNQVSDTLAGHPITVLAAYGHHEVYEPIPAGIGRGRSGQRPGLMPTRRLAFNTVVLNYRLLPSSTFSATDRRICKGFPLSHLANQQFPLL